MKLPSVAVLPQAEPTVQLAVTAPPAMAAPVAAVPVVKQRSKERRARKANRASACNAGASTGFKRLINSSASAWFSMASRSGGVTVAKVFSAALTTSTAAKACSLRPSAASDKACCVCSQAAERRAALPLASTAKPRPSFGASANRLLVLRVVPQCQAAESTRCL